MINSWGVKIVKSSHPFDINAIVMIDGDDCLWSQYGPYYGDDDDVTDPFHIDVILFTEEVQSKSEFHSVHTCIPISVNFVKHVPQILGHGDNDDDVDDAFSNMCIELKSHFKISFTCFHFIMRKSTLHSANQSILSFSRLKPPTIYKLKMKMNKNGD